MVANYDKPGPATASGPVRHRIVNPSSRDGADDLGRWYVAENYMYGNPKVTADNWAGGVQPQHGNTHINALRLTAPWEAMPIRQQTAEEAYRLVLQHAGASLPRQDAIDARLIEETRRGGTTYEGTAYERDRKVADASKPSGMIDSPHDVGGWPALASAPSPPDSDHDGMPDAWEKKFRLDPRAAADRGLDTDDDGYTDIEEYLNGTDPTQFVDYTLPKNNINTLR